MMMQEFTERTKYIPSAEEYHYIEESYYEFEGTSKDEFCKQWLKDKKSGKWDMEYRFRREMDQKLEKQKAMYEKMLAEKEEMVEFYRPYFDRARYAEGQLKQLKDAVLVAAEIAKVEWVV